MRAQANRASSFAPALSMKRAGHRRQTRVPVKIRSFSNLLSNSIKFTGPWRTRFIVSTAATDRGDVIAPRARHWHWHEREGHRGRRCSHFVRSLHPRRPKVPTQPSIDEGADRGQSRTLSIKSAVNSGRLVKSYFRRKGAGGPNNTTIEVIAVRRWRLSTSRQIKRLYRRAFHNSMRRSPTRMISSIRHKQRRAAEKQVGRKIGFTNAPCGRIQHRHAPVWAISRKHSVMPLDSRAVARARKFCEPKIRPKSVFQLSVPLKQTLDEYALLGHEWSGHGFRDRDPSSRTGHSGSLTRSQAWNARHSDGWTGSRSPQNLIPVRQSHRFTVTLSCNEVMERGQSERAGRTTSALRRLVDCWRAIHTIHHSGLVRSSTTGTLTRISGKERRKLDD